MKVKKFKDKKEEYYFWLIRTESPYFEFSLEKFELTDEKKREFIGVCERGMRARGEFVYIAPYDIESLTSWSWMPYIGGKEYYEKDGYIYKGEVKLSKKEEEECRIILMTKKYNL